MSDGTRREKAACGLSKAPITLQNESLLTDGMRAQGIKHAFACRASHAFLGNRNLIDSRKRYRAYRVMSCKAEGSKWSVSVGAPGPFG